MPATSPTGGKPSRLRPPPGAARRALPAALRRCIAGRSFQELPAAAFLYVIVSNLQYEDERVLNYTVGVATTTD
jgi:hypothetical protein